MAFKMKGAPYSPPLKQSTGKSSGKSSGKSEFEAAFAAARSAGKKVFKYKGKEYNTMVKGESGRVVSEASEKAGVNAYQFSDGSQAQFPKNPYKSRD